MFSFLFFIDHKTSLIQFFNRIDSAYNKNVSRHPNYFLHSTPLQEIQTALTLVQTKSHKNDDSRLTYACIVQDLEEALEAKKLQIKCALESATTQHQTPSTDERKQIKEQKRSSRQQKRLAMRTQLDAENSPKSVATHQNLQPQTQMQHNVDPQQATAHHEKIIEELIHKTDYLSSLMAWAMCYIDMFDMLKNGFLKRYVSSTMLTTALARILTYLRKNHISPHQFIHNHGNMRLEAYHPVNKTQIIATTMKNLLKKAQIYIEQAQGTNTVIPQSNHSNDNSALIEFLCQKDLMYPQCKRKRSNYLVKLINDASDEEIELTIKLLRTKAQENSDVKDIFAIVLHMLEEELIDIQRINAAASQNLPYLHTKHARDMFAKIRSDFAPWAQKLHDVLTVQSSASQHILRKNARRAKNAIAKWRHKIQNLREKEIRAKQHYEKKQHDHAKKLKHDALTRWKNIAHERQSKKADQFLRLRHHDLILQQCLHTIGGQDPERQGRAALRLQHMQTCAHLVSIKYALQCHNHTLVPLSPLMRTDAGRQAIEKAQEAWENHGRPPLSSRSLANIENDFLLEKHKKSPVLNWYLNHLVDTCQNCPQCDQMDKNLILQHLDELCLAQRGLMKYCRQCRKHCIGS